MKKLIVSILLLSSIRLISQDFNIKGSRKGIVSLGARNTFSTFNDGKWENPGTGTGGQFRIQGADWVNTEWFADFISAKIGDFAHRSDMHIGWSVMLYMKKSDTELTLFQPYVVAGHCFDYSKITANNDFNNYLIRKSSAVQAGIGTHINLSPRFDISATAQYMIHLGNEVHAEKVNDKVIMETEKGVNLEGHVLINFSVNYKIADLWRN